jgi:hypothetical protein
MQERHEDQRPKGPARPGWQLQEELAAQARKRAGLVDSPGALERHRATEAAKRAEAAYREDLGGYQPRYAWERH